MRARPEAPMARPLRRSDAEALTDLFTAIDSTFFHPHPMTREESERLVAEHGSDVYGVIDDGARLVAYGMLRGWDEGYEVPSLGIAVRRDEQGRGYGRLMMGWLTDEARRRGARQIRLRVHPDNAPARRLYESLGWLDAGEERGERVMTLDLEANTASSGS